jgi:BNR/Asp-box repeat protein
MAYPLDLAPGTVMLSVGTKRGLFLVTSTDRKNWTVTPTALEDSHVYNAVLDQRKSPRLFAADNGDFFGTFLRYSDDFGQTWAKPERGIAFPEGGDLALKNIWLIEPGREDTPDRVYVGVDPASLWVSEDRGDTWSINEGLANHPTRDQWNPGAGGLCLHSIVVDRANPDRMWVAISAVGVLRSDDGGKTWNFKNKNTRASFQPDIYPEFGQCVHRLVQRPDQPETLYQQNHCGVYRSDNAGDDWRDIQGVLPSEFGFPMALDPHHPDTFFTVVEGETRANFAEGFRVYRTHDGGENWETLTKGLPQGDGVRLGVLRHGMCVDGLESCGVYVGTNTGQLFASADQGDSWTLVADYLPSIFSVTAAVIA